MVSVHQRREQQEQVFDKLLDHTYELGEIDFNPLTPVSDMASHKEKDMTTLTIKGEHTLMAYEDQIIEAEKVMSL